MTSSKESHSSEQANLHDSTKSSNVKVFVRVRPANEKESLCGTANVIKIIDDYMLTFDPKEDEISNFGVAKPQISVLDKKIRDLNFVFDRVFDKNASNNQVFKHVTEDVLNGIFDGYNCCMFAYGATSAGKTHTMLGSPEEPGVIFLTMMELYRKLKEKTDKYDIDISVSYLEIYNETCKDLLLPTGPLAVREDPDKGVCVNGLSLHKPRSAEELLDMLHFGNLNRTQHPTDANKQSSRSHAVFQVFVKQSPKVAGLSATVKVSKISLIDLAGSERATVTTNQGDRLREGANINKSLLALGNCINALAENKSNNHIPFRNSKLTRLLKDSLGGNCKTIMIAAVSPSSLSYEDTYNTLKYANRAKSIKSNLSVNTLTVNYHISQYASIVNDLKSQISDLQQKLEAHSNGNVACINGAEVDKNAATLERFDNQLIDLYGEKLRLKRDLIQCEADERKLKLKVNMKEKSYSLRQGLKMLNLFDVEEDAFSMEKQRMFNQEKLGAINEQKIRLEASLTENRNQMNRLQNEIDQFANQASSDIRNKVNLMYETKQTTLENFYLQKQAKYLKRCFKMQTGEFEKQEKVALKMVDIIKVQTNVIEHYKSCSETSPPQACQNLQDVLEDLVELLQGHQKISWADQSCSDLNVPLPLASVLVTNFASCTPSSTASRKPFMLRQMVYESRRKSNMTEENAAHNLLTERNTMLNTGPIRSRLVLTEPISLEPGEETINSSKVEVAKGSPFTRSLKQNNINCSDSIDLLLNPANLTDTSVVRKPIRPTEDLSRTEIEEAASTTSFVLSSQEDKSSFPARVPLKLYNKRNLPIPKENRSRIRAHTTGDCRFNLPSTHQECEKSANQNNKSTSRHVKNRSIYNFRRKNVYLGPPSRPRSSVDVEKENKQSTNLSLVYENSRGLKPALGSSSFRNSSIVCNEKGRFRF